MLLLAAMLVLVQVLGMMHAVLHDHARVSPAAAPVALHDQSAEGSWVQALFEGHDSQAECDDFDHMTHVDQARVEPAEFEVDRSQSIEIAIHAGWQIAQQAAGFLARGPPSKV